MPSDLVSMRRALEEARAMAHDSIAIGASRYMRTLTRTPTTGVHVGAEEDVLKMDSQYNDDDLYYHVANSIIHFLIFITAVMADTVKKMLEDTYAQVYKYTMGMFIEAEAEVDSPLFAPLTQFFIGQDYYGPLVGLTDRNSQPPQHEQPVKQILNMIIQATLRDVAPDMFSTISFHVGFRYMLNNNMDRYTRFVASYIRRGVSDVAAVLLGQKLANVADKQHQITHFLRPMGNGTFINESKTLEHNVLHKIQLQSRRRSVDALKMASILARNVYPKRKVRNAAKDIEKAKAMQAANEMHATKLLESEDDFPPWLRDAATLLADSRID